MVRESSVADFVPIDAFCFICVLLLQLFELIMLPLITLPEFLELSLPTDSTEGSLCCALLFLHENTMSSLRSIRFLEESALLFILSLFLCDGLCLL